MKRVRDKLTYANVMVTILAFILLGGFAYAAAHLRKNTVTSRAIKNGQVRGVDLAPNAIDSSKVKDGAIESADLSGELTTSLRAECPPSLDRAGDLCYEASLRASETFGTALQTCASAGRWLPSLGELALVFDHLGAPQQSQWVATQYFDQSGTGTSLLATLLGENSSRSLQFGADASDTHTQPYRCVTLATN